MNIIQYNEDFNKQVKFLIENHNLTAGKILKSKKYNQLYNYVINCTNFLTQKQNLITRMFYTIYKINSEVKCKTCKKILKYGNIKNKNVTFFRDAFNMFCSPRCGQLHEDTKNKLNKTNLKKYGYKWTFQTENNLSKSRATMIKKYGYEYAQQNKKIKQKQINTMLDRYGVEVFSQSKKLLSKATITRRKTEYKKFIANTFVIPQFSEDDYVKHGNLYNYKWKCNKCGDIFKSFKNVSWFKQGAVKSYARCEKCYPYGLERGTSTYEKEVANYIKTINSSTINSTNENRKIIEPYELDIYVPGKKLAIEFDGLYWHSEVNGIASSYHLNKTELCEEQGIQLIHIFEDEWLHKQDIVKSRLKNILGIYDKTIFARKCEVREISSKESMDFQEENHIQGAVGASVHLGLFYEDELISLMTFGKTRFSKKYEYELLRFCNKLNYHVPGGAGKLLKYFERNYNPKNIVSYADRRWSQGKLYKALGFELSHKSPPNYWYWKRLARESRVKYQKHKLEKLLENFDPNKTEVENMKDNGYNRIFDCGNLVYVKT